MHSSVKMLSQDTKDSILITRIRHLDIIAEPNFNDIPGTAPQFANQLIHTALPA